MKKLSLLAIVAAAFSFSACNNSSNTTEGSSDTIIADTTTLGEHIDNGIDTMRATGEAAESDVNAAAKEVKADAKTTGENIKGDLNAAKEDVGDAAKAAGRDIKNAADKVADKTKEGYNDVKKSLKKDSTRN
ncbi:hypothetical protein [Olivibacter sp. XZL3]|uniref:hypothetical protein n=1 Tax=Olivibacter sp. XZL3 TaxID=1735116 RepID=UPI0010669BE9|nr:hypothetical protein [Olivibacter sp. XZL3]